jgi:hypothetical protein
MNDETEVRPKVIYLRPRNARAVRLRAIVGASANVARRLQGLLVGLLCFAISVFWPLCRMVLCALLVLIEPLLRITLVPLALLGFLVTLFYGFRVDDPNFPKWGMLALSLGSLCAYWLYMALLAFMIGGRRGR